MTEKRMFIGCRMKIFFSVLLVFCLAGCGSDSAKEAAVPAVPAVPASQVETSEATTSTSQSVDLPALEEYESVLSQRITFTDESADKIREYISNIDVEYEYSSLYHLDEAMECFENIGEYCEASEFKLIKNNQVDPTELYNVVLENNKNIPKNVIVMKDKEIKKVVDIVCDQINKKLSETNNIPLERLEYTLANLKIFDYKSFGTAYMSLEEPLLCVNLISVESQQEGQEETDVFDVSVRHETDHLLQISYPKDDSYEANAGVCYQFKDLAIDSLYWKWYVEGAAEKMTLDVNGDPYVYDLNIRILDMLTLATVLEETAGITDVEELSIQHDMDKFFEKFNAVTDAEKEEIIKMMISYDLVCNNTEEFSKLYEEEYQEKFDVYIKEEVQYNVQSSAAQTLAKVFYQNLAECVAENEVSINEIFSFISLFETKMNSVMRFGDSAYMEHKKKFFEGYSDIQMHLFEEVSKYIEADATELKDIYCSYQNAIISSNYSYSFLPADKQELLKAIQESCVYFRTMAIIGR